MARPCAAFWRAVIILCLWPGVIGIPSLHFASLTIGVAIIVISWCLTLSTCVRLDLNSSNCFAIAFIAPIATFAIGLTFLTFALPG